MSVRVRLEHCGVPYRCRDCGGHIFSDETHYVELRKVRGIERMVGSHDGACPR